MIGSVLSIVGQLVSQCLYFSLCCYQFDATYCIDDESCDGVFFVSAVLFYTNRTKISCKVSLVPHYFVAITIRYRLVSCVVRTCCFDVLFFTHHINSGFFTQDIPCSFGVKHKKNSVQYSTTISLMCRSNIITQCEVVPQGLIYFTMYGA